MKINSVIIATIAVTALMITNGCTTSDVVPAGPDTYTVSASGAGFSDAKVRENVLQKANEFCAAHGLVMVPVSLDSRPGEVGRHPPSADLVFRALKPGDPDIKRPNFEGPDQIIRVQER
jgi:hypothetical protein